MDIAAKGFSAFDNFMPDHRGDIDLDAHHYQARTRAVLFNDVEPSLQKQSVASYLADIENFYILQTFTRSVWTIIEIHLQM